MNRRRPLAHMNRRRPLAHMYIRSPLAHMNREKNTYMLSLNKD